MPIGLFKSSTSRVSFNSTPEVCNFVGEQNSDLISKEITYASKGALVGKDFHINSITNGNLIDGISFDTYAGGHTVKHNIA